MMAWSHLNPLPLNPSTEKAREFCDSKAKQRLLVTILGHAHWVKVAHRGLQRTPR